MKRIACLLAAVLLAAALLVGCNAGTPADASGATTPPESLETAEPTAEPEGMPETTAQPSPEPTEEPKAPDALPEEPLPEGGRAWSLTPLDLDENITFDPTQQGDAITLYVYTTEDEWDNVTTWVDIDGTAYKLNEEDSMFCGAWLYMKNLMPVLFTTVDMASDDYNLTAWRIEDGKPVKTGDLYGTIEGATEDGRIIVGSAVYAFGTWWATRIYDVDAEGAPVPAENSLYEIVPVEGNELRTVRALPVELQGANGYEKAELPAGTVITPLATDDDSLFYFILDDGREGRIVFERREGEIFVDGKADVEYFEMLWYAG